MSAALVQGATRGLGLALVEALLRRGVAPVFATGRQIDRSEGLDALEAEHGEALVRMRLDVCDEGSIAEAAARVSETADRLHALVNCAGLLHDSATGLRPEKRLEQLDPEHLRRAFEVNAIGPLLMARHFLPLLAHDERSTLVNVSARVGSIGDDRAGGWYAYRGSKAAQNLFTKNLSIELRRRAPRCLCIAYHPGTVDTDLSKPFQRSVPEGKLFSPGDAASKLLAVVDGLGSDDSGRFFAWDGSEVPW